MEKLENTQANSGCFMGGVYYRMYLAQRTDLVCIVCMQNFDEHDYHEERFVRDEEGERYYWIEEEDAKKQMALWYKKEDVEEEYHYLFGGENLLVR